MIPSEEIYDKLNAEGFSNTMFIGYNPYPDLDKYIIIREGYASANPKWLRDEVTLQIQGVSKREKYKEGMEMMLAAREILNGADPFDTADSTNSRFIVQNGPNYVGPDENTRHNFSMNLQYIREPFSGKNRETIG
mgnify:CR=1 FL=1